MSQNASRPQSSKFAANPKLLYGTRTCVLHLCPQLDPEDPGREVVELAILTQRSGWRALIASGGGPLVNDGERAAVRHIAMPLGKRGLFTDWRNRLHLEALVQKERPALFHAHGIEALRHAHAIGRIHRLPLLADLTQPLDTHPTTHKLIAQLLQSPSLIRVPSNYMGQHLMSTFGVPADRLRLIPPGMDFNWYNAGSISAERLQKLSHLWRLPEQASIILVPMPLNPGLGHKVFLQAMARLKDDNVFAVLVGHDRQAPGLSKEIDQLVNEYQLNGKVIMPEFCTDWPAACWLASVVVAPNSAPRGQNRALLAAQSIGRPVIVTDSGANVEMVLRDETAWITPPDNVNNLTEALSQILRMNTNQRLHLAERAHEFIAEMFPQSGWFEAMISVYESMLPATAQSVRAATASAST